jgi:hypothetical protein
VTTAHPIVQAFGRRSNSAGVWTRSSDRAQDFPQLRVEPTRLLHRLIAPSDPMRNYSAKIGEATALCAVMFKLRLRQGGLDQLYRISTMPEVAGDAHATAYAVAPCTISGKFSLAKQPPFATVALVVIAARSRSEISP